VSYVDVHSLASQSTRGGRDRHERFFPRTHRIKSTKSSSGESGPSFCKSIGGSRAYFPPSFAVDVLGGI
jgi:hypothetical protein